MYHDSLSTVHVSCFSVSEKKENKTDVDKNKKIFDFIF